MMMDDRATTSPNYYELLQLQPYANPALVTAAYRILSKLYHPDTAKEQANPERFRQLQQAYEILSDPQKRQEYDRELRVREPGLYTNNNTAETNNAQTDNFWGTPSNDTSWNYNPSEEDLAFYRSLYDYDKPARRRRAFLSIFIYVCLMAAAVGFGIWGFVTIGSPDGSRGRAVFYFLIGIGLAVLAQVEAYFS